MISFPILLESRAELVHYCFKKLELDIWLLAYGSPKLPYLVIINTNILVCAWRGTGVRTVRKDEGISKLLTLFECARL